MREVPGSVVLNHCWTGHPGYGWYPHYVRAMADAGVEVRAPQFPRPAQPRVAEWQACLARHVDLHEPGETVLLGHSLGAWNVLKFLESYEGPRFARVILVAPVLEALGIPEVDAFLSAGLTLSPLTEKSRDSWALLSPDDPYLGERCSQLCRLLTENSGARVCLLPGRGHFSEAGGVFELPELVELSCSGPGPGSRPPGRSLNEWSGPCTSTP